MTFASVSLSAPMIMILGTVIAYLAVLAVIGEYARRRTTADREDFFLGSRSFKTVALLFSLLATLLTAFTVIGVPGLTYRDGIGAYGYVGSASTLIIPIILATVGYRLWLAGKRFGHITPGQFVNHRYEATYLGAVVMGLLTFWTVPYLLLGAVGGGLTISSMTQNAVSYPVGAGIVLLVVFLYVMAGGMRGTTYTNIFQGGLFLLLLCGFLTYLGVMYGGFGEATAAALDANPDLGSRAGGGPFTTQGWISFLVISAFGVPMFPHMFMRILTGNSVNAYRKMVALFPIGVTIAFTTVTFLGFWGAGQIPGLTGQEADQILPMLIGQSVPTALIGLGIVTVLAAIMSTLDAQTLTVSTMITEDLVRPVTATVSDAREILFTRLILAAIFVAVFGLALLQPGTVFWLGEFAFQGFALIFYPALIGLYWKNTTRHSVYAGLFTGFIGIWLFQLNVLPAWLTFGFRPFIPVLLVQILAVHGVSYVTAQPSDERISRYFDTFRGVW